MGANRLRLPRPVPRRHRTLDALASPLVSESITQGLTDNLAVLVSRDLRAQNSENAYRMLIAHRVRPYVRPVFAGIR